MHVLKNLPQCAINAACGHSARSINAFALQIMPLLRLVLLQATPEWERTVLRLTSNRGNDEVLPHWLALRQTARCQPLCIQATHRLHVTLHLRPPPVHTLALASEHYHLCLLNAQGTGPALALPLNIHPSAGHDLPLTMALGSLQVRSWLQACCGARVLV